MDNLSKVYVGVDISKNSLDIHIHPLEKAFTIRNCEEDILKFIKELSRYKVEQIACEATGGYEKSLAQLLKKHGYDLWIIDPRRIKGFIVAMGCKSKTDRIDAQKIAEFAAKNIKSYDSYARTDEQEKLHALVNRRNDLIKYLAAEKTRLDHPSHALSIKNIKKFVGILEKEIKTIDQQIQSLIKANSSLGKKSEILESIPGIGKSSAAVFLSFVPELGQLSNEKISALIGVCPYDNASGQYQGKKFIKGGRLEPRNALYMCALTAIKYNHILRAFYDRLRQKNKPFKVAIVAIMHKLIILANSLLKKGELCKI